MTATHNHGRQSADQFLAAQGICPRCSPATYADHAPHRADREVDAPPLLIHGRLSLGSKQSQCPVCQPKQYAEQAAHHRAPVIERNQP